MKKRVRRVLLPLLFSFCFVFSGFLSVNVFADEELPFKVEGLIPFNFSGQSGVYNFYNNSNVLISSSVPTFRTDSNIGTIYTGSFTSNITNVSKFDFGIIDGYTYPFIIPNLSDYKFIVLCFRGNIIPSDYSFLPNKMSIYSNDFSGRNEIFLDNFNITNFQTGLSGQPSTIGYIYSGDIPENFNSSIINGFTLSSDVSGVIPANFMVSMYLYNNINNDFDDNFNSIISALNDQTNQLSSDIGQAADDVQQSIEDQYSGDPEEEFSVDDVITQHNEKMGVLSFGSDVMIQFLDIFSSANAGDATLTFPGFILTVEGQDHQVWPDYQFNFALLDEWLPALMSVIRMMLPAFVWLMVLRYCINVFEKNFLSNGG